MVQVGFGFFLQAQLVAVDAITISVHDQSKANTFVVVQFLKLHDERGP